MVYAHAPRFVPLFILHLSRHVRQHTHTLISHDWSFLEGAKHHRHTLKAGRHVFPFSLDLDGTVPSTMVTSHASVLYKLRATVIRSAFSSNWVAQKSVTVIRSFVPEALEYNQTLEIENTWPGKLMYSIMVPHKAFAAGDDIPVLLKFSPVAKGVNVLRVESQVKEYTIVRWKNQVVHQDTRTVAQAKHVIRNGRAVNARAVIDTSTEQPSRSPSFLARTRPTSSDGARDSASGSIPPSNSSISRMAALSSAVLLAPGLARDDWQGEGASQQGSSRASIEGLEMGDQDVDTSIRIPIPPHVAPTHTTGQCITATFGKIEASQETELTCFFFCFFVFFCYQTLSPWCTSSSGPSSLPTLTATLRNYVARYLSTFFPTACWMKLELPHKRHETFCSEPRTRALHPPV
jgi:arrestin-related trafficking adapter 4/5/7